jgi:hypothetical protein
LDTEATALYCKRPEHALIVSDRYLEVSKLHVGTGKKTHVHD